jgi:hypothetical protein
MEETVQQHNRFMSRKFIITLLVIFLSSILLYLRFLDAETWKTVIGTVVLGYFVGNVGTTAVEKWISK